MRIQAVIFDMDGVIFDTERLALKVWMRTAEELGIPDIELLYPSCIGTNYARTQEILYDRYGSSFPQNTDSPCATVRERYAASSAIRPPESSSDGNHPS